MNRRSVLERWYVVLGVVGIWLLAAGGSAWGDEPQSAERPNILLIVADDLGWGDVGWHGGMARTPHLDQLVRTGVELDQHYVQPVCTPTRAALLTGRYPGRFGPHALAPSNLRALPLDTITLAEALRSLGYHTYQVGKWHLGGRQEWGPTGFGFDHAYGTLTGAADPWTHKYRAGSPYEDTWHRDGVRLDEEGNATELVAAEAVRRIEERHEPWFLCVGFHAVHTPVDAPEEYKQLYAGQPFADEVPRHDSRLRMLAMISQMDAKVGEMVAALEATGQRERTLVIFTSDNGGIESVKNAYVGTVADSPYNSENAPLRGEKNTLYEGGVRVAAFAHWPGRLAPRRCTVPLHAVDWFPTLAGLVGYRPAEDLGWDGIEQWGALARGEPAPAERVIYIAMKSGACAVRRGGWKLIHRPPPKHLRGEPARGTAGPQGGEDRPGVNELFDLDRDPNETQNVAGEHPQVVAELTAALERERARDNLELPEDLVGVED